MLGTWNRAILKTSRIRGPWDCHQDYMDIKIKGHGRLVVTITFTERSKEEVECKDGEMLTSMVSSKIFVRT